MPREIRDAASELRLQIGHTSDFGSEDLRSAQRLLQRIFEGDFGDDDWAHASGGSHVFAWKDDELIGHASLVSRQLLCCGRALCTGYVEAVGVERAHQRVGVGGRMMELLEGKIAESFELGALSASDVGAAFYQARGWLRWQGPLSAVTPSGVVRTEDEDGGVYVWPPTLSLDRAQPLAADFRDGDIW